MRRQLEAMACLGCLAALGFPVPPAGAQSPSQPRADRQSACRVVALRPFVSAGTVRGTAVRAGCAGQAKPRVRTKGRPASNSGFASAPETAVVKQTNAARSRNGCRPLVHDAKLHLAAERHSADMARRNYFSHTSRDGRSFGKRITAAGFAFRRAAENIAKGQPSAAAVVRAWLNSPGHRANIMNCSLTHIGVGHNAKGPTWTQDFAAR